jgi:hypothetical protein
MFGGKMEMSDKEQHFTRCAQCLDCWPVKEK